MNRPTHAVGHPPLKGFSRPDISACLLQPHRHASLTNVPDSISVTDGASYTQAGTHLPLVSNQPRFGDRDKARAGCPFLPAEPSDWGWTNAFERIVCSR